jgi:hypothetical protein
MARCRGELKEAAVPKALVLEAVPLPAMVETCAVDRVMERMRLPTVSDTKSVVKVASMVMPRGALKVAAALQEWYEAEPTA